MRPCNSCSTPVDNGSLLCRACENMESADDAGEVPNRQEIKDVDVDGSNLPWILMSAAALIIVTTTATVLLFAFFTGNQMPLSHSAGIGTSIGLILVAANMLVDWLSGFGP